MGLILTNKKNGFSYCSVLGNVTNVIVNVDEFKVHENKDGSVDKTKTDVYLHLVDKKDNSILDVSDVLRLVDLNIEKLDGLFKVCCLFNIRFYAEYNYLIFE